MDRRKGFHLVDCLLALFLVTVGLTAALGLSLKSQQNLIRTREHSVAWAILNNATRQPVEQLNAFPRRYYDLWGRPTQRTDAFYILEIVPSAWVGGTQYEVSLRYKDFDGFPRRRVISRFSRGESCVECP